VNQADVASQHGKSLSLYGFAQRTGNRATLEFKIDAGYSGIQVTYSVCSPILMA
jgi:hypothetical protein